MAGCILMARFWDENERDNKLFKFQGPYDGPQTLEPSEGYKNKGSAERGKDDEASSTSSGEYCSD
jgi:hypothetical protein